ncbi:MAG TPA: cellulase family glycosylhydrolase, partial [Armatimonadota bacterium]|nr:cellulase family glycosylhydrolase [Armatimonadota bacterium]
ITRREFLHSLTTDLASYRPGETAEISVQMVCDRDPERYPTVTLLVDDREVADRSSAEVEIDSLTGDYHVVRAELRIGDDLVDSLESAFCVWDESVLASGAKVAWENNYITLDGKPSFLIGTNQTGMMYFSPKEGPAAWDRDFRAMHDHGFHIWRILHFSPFAAKGYEGSGQHTSLDLYNRPERFLRQMDAIVQIAQKHRVAIFLALHDWLGVTLTDEELEAQYDWCRFWADRYKDVPGIFYDIQNEPSVAAEDRPDVVELWNDFLATRYASDEALRAAWTTSPPEAELPNVPLGATTNDWDDARAADRKRFETELLNRWTKANVDGTKAGDPDAVICVGYLPSMPPADKILGVKNTDFSNMHYYGPVDRFPLEFKLIDRRFQGKGFSLGEFGAREAHDARSHGHTSIPVDDSIHRFQTYIHYTAGLGAAFMANWDWKEFDEAIFPWGLFQRSSYVSRPWMHTLEQGALLLSVAEPVYESPEVFIVAPDSHRVGPRFSELNGCLWRAIDLLLDQRVNFGMVNEEDIADLPDSAKALIWPVPYCPADETFDAIRSWVEAGGTL